MTKADEGKKPLFTYIFLLGIILWLYAHGDHLSKSQGSRVKSSRPDRKLDFSASSKEAAFLCGGLGTLEFPLYYNDGTMFQMGPSTHNVWGFTNRDNCSIHVREECSGNTTGK